MGIKLCGKRAIETHWPTQPSSQSISGTDFIREGRSLAALQEEGEKGEVRSRYKVIFLRCLPETLMKETLG